MSTVRRVTEPVVNVDTVFIHTTADRIFTQNSIQMMHYINDLVGDAENVLMLYADSSLHGDHQ